MEPLRHLLVVLCMTSTAISQDPPPPVYRLPTSVSPVNYMIRLAPDLDGGTVTGAVMIELQTTSNQSETLTSITLHLGIDVKIDESSAMLVDSSGVMKNIGAFLYDDQNTLLTIKLPDDDPPLKYNHIYMLSLKFSSVLHSEPVGLFSGYINSSSKYVAANLRPTHARDVFPCFDELQFKVPVTLQVLRPADYIAVSTAPLALSAEPNDSNMVLDTFSSTGPISIHSLGLFVSPITPVSAMGVNVFVPQGIPSTVPYLETLISNINTRLGPFPVSPLNLVVLPDQIFTSFSSYGFVFTSPEVYSGDVSCPIKWSSLKLQLTEQFLRQFLEYNKTPQWWSDIWLSESLGAYLGTILLANDDPFMSDWLKIVVRSNALGPYNGTIGPVVNTQLLSKWDIEDALASQSIRNKGLSILTMWADTMFDGLVNKTASDYLNLKNSIVTTSDLYEVMVANMRANTTYDVTPTIPLLANWLTAAGSPLLWYLPSPDLGTFTIDQATPCPTLGSSPPVLRPVSISVVQNDSETWNNIRQGRWLLNGTTQFLAPSSLTQWTIINAEAAPVRVHYADDWCSQIIPALQTDLTSDSSPTSVRAALQDDAVALSLNGCLDFSIALNVLNSTQHSNADWLPVAKAAEAFTARISGDWYGYSAFRDYFASLFTTDLLAALDLKNSSSNPSLRLGRLLISPWLCEFDIGNCREAVGELGAQLWQGDASKIDPSDIETVACYSARYNPLAVNFFFQNYPTSTSPWNKYLYTIGLSCTVNSTGVQQILDSLVNSTTVISIADSRKIISGLANSLENSAILTDFIVDHALDIQARFGAGTLSGVIRTLAKYRVDLSKLQALSNISLGLDAAVIQATADAISMTTANEAWWDSLGHSLLASLPQQNITTTPAVTTTNTSPTTSTATTTTITTKTTPTTTTTSKPPTTAKPGPTPSSTPSPPSAATSLVKEQIVSLIFGAVMFSLSFYM